MMKLSTILFVIFYLIVEIFGQNNPLGTDYVIVSRSKEGYHYSLWTKDSLHFETAKFADTDKSDNINLNVRGFYKFYDSDGKTYSVRYQADDKGYHPMVLFGPETSEEIETHVGTLVIKSLSGGGLG